MIVEWFLNLVASFLEGMAEWVGPGTLSPPPFLETSAGALSNLLRTVHGLGVWIPTDLAFLVAAAIINLYIGGGLVRLVRMGVSLFTGGGGSAA